MVSIVARDAALMPCSNVVLASVLRAFIRVRSAHSAAHAHTHYVQPQPSRTSRETRSLNGASLATPNTSLDGLARTARCIADTPLPRAESYLDAEYRLLAPRRKPR